MKTAQMFFGGAFAASFVAAGVAFAGPTTPGNSNLDEIPGNSFTQQWRQDRTATFQPDEFRFEVVAGPTDFGMKKVTLPGGGNPFNSIGVNGGPGNTASSAGALFAVAGSQGSSKVRFNITFDNFNGVPTNASGQQEFAWTIRYFDNGSPIGGFLWSNYADDSVTAGLLGIDPSDLDRRGGGFGGDWYAMPTSMVIPLPSASVLGAAGVAVVATRRRRSA